VGRGSPCNVFFFGGKVYVQHGKVYDNMWAEDRPVIFLCVGKVYHGMWAEERPVMFFFSIKIFY